MDLFEQPYLLRRIQHVDWQPIPIAWWEDLLVHTPTNFLHNLCHCDHILRTANPDQLWTLDKSEVRQDRGIRNQCHTADGPWRRVSTSACTSSSDSIRTGIPCCKNWRWSSKRVTPTSSAALLKL